MEFAHPARSLPRSLADARCLWSGPAPKHNGGCFPDGRFWVVELRARLRRERRGPRIDSSCANLCIARSP